jgi:hypothetical protein
VRPAVLASLPAFRGILDWFCCWGDPGLSAVLPLELAVVAEETGRRGLELRRGGEVFGRGTAM